MTDDWTLHAACRGKPTELWFPAQGDPLAVAVARRICAGCPVRAECLADALGDAERHGVWGGTSARERRGLRGSARAPR